MSRKTFFAALLSALLTLFLLSGCIPHPGNYEVKSIVVNPKESLSAIGFTRTTKEAATYEVMIERGSQVTFRYAPKRVVLIAEGAKDVDLIWEDDTSLRVELAYTTLLHAGGDVEGVKINVVRKSTRPLNSTLRPPGHVNKP